VGGAAPLFFFKGARVYSFSVIVCRPFTFPPCRFFFSSKLVFGGAALDVSRKRTAGEWQLGQMSCPLPVHMPLYSVQKAAAASGKVMETVPRFPPSISDSSSFGLALTRAVNFPHLGLVGGPFSVRGLPTWPIGSFPGNGDLESPPQGIRFIDMGRCICVCVRELLD